MPLITLLSIKPARPGTSPIKAARFRSKPRGFLFPNNNSQGISFASSRFPTSDHASSLSRRLVTPKLYAKEGY